MRQPYFIIKIAADAPELLRRSDVERVIKNCSDDELAPTADYIKAHRPDLTAKVDEEVTYSRQEREMVSAKGVKYVFTPHFGLERA